MPSVSQLFTPQTPQQWLATLLADGQSLGLSSTAWQSGQPILTILQILGLELSKEDTLGISLRAQGGFLDFAATGSVVSTDYNGNTVTLPVTPDPSIPSQNPTGAPGLLDSLASSVYNVQRSKASAASNPLYLANTSGSSLGTFQPGTFHTQNVLTKATYSNQQAFTFSASAVVGGATIASSPVTPVLVSFSVAHGLATGAVVFAQSLGTVSDNFYTITVIDALNVSLNGTVGGGGVFPGLTPPGANCYIPQQIVFAADTLGPGANAGIGNINQLITSAPKSYCSNLVTFAGAPWQSNVSLAAACRSKLATLSPNGSQGAYLFFSLASYLILSGQVLPGGTPPAVTSAINAYLAAAGVQGLASPIPSVLTLDGGPVTRALVALNPASGAVTVTLANATGGVPGGMNFSITGATTAAPIVITCPAHGFVTGDYCQVNGVQGLTGANGQWQLTRIDANNFSLNGSSGSGAYTASSGQVSGGDLYAVAAVLNAYCTPSAVTVTTLSATNVTVTPAATVYVPIASVADYVTKMTALLTSYFTSFPIGGLTVDGQSNVLPIGAVEGLLFAAGQNNGQIYTLSVTGVTINGAPNDVVLSAQGVAILGVLTGINVVGV